MITLEKTRKHFIENKVLYTSHAKHEMETDEFGSIKEEEVFQAVVNGEIIEAYKTDKPYPSVLINGKTIKNRPLHIVCSYSPENDIVIIITVYHPNPALWISFRRRK
ncbi:MAG: hypothetical protein A2252_01855 [Elusimicrobia bacterium RIFOXYA2_FULL_39_19]|nr:MAG: hypothetical protein A2252_01855 [Elusimicrobia bacterium RIFOXYA2_FULL_39_19]